MTPSMHDKYFTTGKQRPSQNDKLENGRVEPPLLSHISHTFDHRQQKRKPNFVPTTFQSTMQLSVAHRMVLAMDIEDEIPGKIVATKS